MDKADLKVELVERYCPLCHIDTQHAILFQLTFGRRGQPQRQDELSSACAICNPDRFWGLKFATSFDQEKFLLERWMPRST